MLVGADRGQGEADRKLKVNTKRKDREGDRGLLGAGKGCKGSHKC